MNCVTKHFRDHDDSDVSLEVDRNGAKFIGNKQT